MRKIVTTSFFLLILSLTGFTLSFFIFPDRMQNFIVETLNLKNYLNQKVENFIEKKINDENINVNIETINFLKPDWSNIAKIELGNISINTLGQKRNSKINFIELGFSFDKLIKNFILNENNIEFSYINIEDLTLNAKLEKDKFLPGPLVKIFSTINQNEIRTQSSLKKILESKIVIGKINFLLIDNRNLLEERFYQINCKNVLISEITSKSRSIHMDCNKGNNNKFSLTANLAENSNTFKGNLQNIKPNLFLDSKFIENFILLKQTFDSEINGTYNIKTNKAFDIESLNILLNESILVSHNKEDKEIFKTKISGVLSWEKKNNLLKFSDMFLGGQLAAYGELDLTSKKGHSNFSIKKILVEDSKIYLNKYFNFYTTPYALNIKNNLNKFKGGYLKNISIDIKFSLFEELILREINGFLNFSNSRFDYNNQIFKKILSTISGNIEFRYNPKKKDETLVDLNLNASEGFILFNNHNLKYKFNKAKIKGKFHNNKYVISKADFYKNKKLEYTFQNVEINNNNLIISRAKYLTDDKLKYDFNDTKISNLNVIKSFVKIKYNTDIYNIIKRKFDIEVIGDSDINILLSGDLKKLNFNLKLEIDLKNSYLDINYIDVIKKENISSYFKSELSFVDGKIESLENLFLTVKNDIYKIDQIDFNYKKESDVLIKNIHTPNQNINKILISKIGKDLNISASGKKINLSNIKEKIQKNFNAREYIYLDLTADLIQLNSKISLIGNLKGKIKDSSFKSTAYGKIQLGDLSIIDNGKFDIYMDDKISSLEGLGLVGGAETRINLRKKKNHFPSLIFNTSDGGKLLSVLNFTKNIKSGEMKININFLNDKYNHYEGQIESSKFSLINAPGIINSLSVLSFTGISSIISGEGVFFDKGQAKINVKDKILNFEKLYLTSESLGIAAKGQLNVEKKSIDLTGSVAPIKLISKIISVVPAVGQLLTGLKKEGLIAGQFKMSGLIKTPKITLNTMSFAPGILRDLFSDNWLEKNSFFYK